MNLRSGKTYWPGFLCLWLFSLLPAWASQTKVQWDGNRTVPVHLIPLKDEFDQQIIPTESFPYPFSARYTCAPCHDYRQIAGGWHFNSITSETNGRPGEPWFWVEKKTGTILPLSYRGWPNTWSPNELNLSNWDVTLLFARHMPGGGAAEPEEPDPDPASRWEVSGKLEVNCLACHHASGLQSHSEWAKQVLRQNFRWAAAAASGLGEVGGMASRLPGTWTIIDGPNPDDTEYAVVPSVRYDRDRFDSRHWVFFDIDSRPQDRRCLVCHSVSPADLPRYAAQADVHTAAGLGCTDCHRNDISHAILRGYEDEGADTGNPHAYAFSCRGCHLGESLSRLGGPDAGRLGAPYPRHSGIPKIHFERLSCTACHSGEVPGKRTHRVRTSRANRLGVYGIARWDTLMPHIQEPVFVRGKSGKITPHRLVWPAYWARLEGDRITPLHPQEILDQSGDVLAAEERIAEILAALAGIEDLAGPVVLVTGGRVFRPNVDRGLDASPAPDTAPAGRIFWGIDVEGRLEPLIPAAVPQSDEIDAEKEARLYGLLEALAGLVPENTLPVLMYESFYFHLTEGYLEEKPLQEQEPVFFGPGFKKDESFFPLIPDFHLRIVKSITGEEYSLTEEQVVQILKSLGGEAVPDDPQSGSGGEFVYISGGRLFRWDEERGLWSVPHEAAEPVTWPLGHQVRPARQALGINGCSDCHSAGSSFFFTRIDGAGPLRTERRESRSGHSFMGLDKPYQMLFGLSFTIRPWFKWLLLGAAFVIGSVCFLALLLALGRLTGLIDKRG